MSVLTLIKRLFDGVKMLKVRGAHSEGGFFDHSCRTYRCLHVCVYALVGDPERPEVAALLCAWFVKFPGCLVNRV